MAEHLVRRPDDNLEAAVGPLPTDRALTIAKVGALQAVQLEVMAAPWPPTAWAHQLLDWAPYLALAALAEAIPETPPWRIAQCLGLDTHAGPQKLSLLRALEVWPAQAVAQIAATLTARPASALAGAIDGAPS